MALQFNTSLISLNLSHNKIGPTGAKDFAMGLQVNTRLTRLDFSHNTIGAAGAKAFAEALYFNTSLIELILQSNKIGDNGANDLAKSLKVNNSLSLLNLSDNEIADKGVEFLADALKVNTGLKSLSIGFNEIGDSGVSYLADALKVNTGLESLSVIENEPEDITLKPLVDALQFNYILQQLHIDGEFKSKIEVYTDRNKAIVMILTPLHDFMQHRRLDGEQITKSLDLLTKFLTSDDEENYLCEMRRLLTALGHMSNQGIGSGVALDALTCLINPFKNAVLMKTANLALGMLLSTDDTALISPEQQQIKNELILYCLSNFLDGPDLATWSYIAYHKLDSNLYNTQVQVRELAQIRNNTALLTYKDLLLLAPDAGRTSNNIDERTLLQGVMKFGAQHQEGLEYLIQCPAFIAQLTLQYPGKTHLALVDRSLSWPGTSQTYPYSLKLPEQSATLANINKSHLAQFSKVATKLIERAVHHANHAQAIKEYLFESIIQESKIKPNTITTDLDTQINRRLTLF